MDNISILSFGSAFIAGLASFLSPCVLPLVPAYISYLGGRSAFEGDQETHSRWSVFSHGLAFVTGFSVVFILLGIATSALGSFLTGVKGWLEVIGGVVVIIFGLHMTGLVRIPFLQYDTRNQVQPDKKVGYLSSFLMGIFFSAGWSPCVGPVLGAILTFSLSGGSVLTGGVLLAAYSAGLSIPFLIAALGVEWVTITIRKYGKVMRYVEIAMGIVMIVIGIMLTFGLFERLSIYLTRFGSLFGG